MTEEKKTKAKTKTATALRNLCTSKGEQVRKGAEFTDTEAQIKKFKSAGAV